MSYQWRWLLWPSDLSIPNHKGLEFFGHLSATCEVIAPMCFRFCQHFEMKAWNNATFRIRSSSLSEEMTGPIEETKKPRIESKGGALLLKYKPVFSRDGKWVAMWCFKILCSLPSSAPISDQSIIVLSFHTYLFRPNPQFDPLLSLLLITCLTLQAELPNMYIQYCHP